MKYSIGDRVRIIEDGWGCADRIGEIGTIRSIDYKNHELLMDDGSVIEYIWSEGFESVEVDSVKSRDQSLESVMVKVIYKSTDGAEFDTLQAAEEHQRVVTVFDDIVKEYGRYGTIEINYLSDFLDILQLAKDKGLTLS